VNTFGRFGAAKRSVNADKFNNDRSFVALPEMADRREQRRVQIIWGGLFLHSWTWINLKVPILIPQRVWQLIALMSLLVAFSVALATNRALLVRPSPFLICVLGLVLVTYIPVMRLAVPFGTLYRVFKFTLWTCTLWLTSPWWGRRDMLILRVHFRCTLAANALVTGGLILFPTAALGGYESGRLVGVFPTLPPPQVGQLATISAGIALLGWNSGYINGRTAKRLIGLCIVLLLLSRTRTALSGLFLGGLLAMVSLISSQAAVRQRMSRLILALPLLILALVPLAPTFLTRGQDTQQITELTGRTKVWASLLGRFRNGAEQFFGVGLTDKSWDGLSIDSGWLSVYHEQGWVGLFFGSALLLFLIAKIVLAPPGFARAVATFIVTYCLIAFVTEVGLGDSSHYLLHLAMAASILMVPTPDDRTFDPRDRRMALGLWLDRTHSPGPRSRDTVDVA
jgi:hypothetical protein